MYFLSSDSRRRHTYVDEVVAETARNLTMNSGVEKRISNETKAALSRQLSHLFMPNVKHGQLVIPKSHRDSNGVPIVALRDDENCILGAGFGKMMVSQLAATTEIIASWRVPRDMVPRAVEDVSRILLHRENKVKIERPDPRIMALVGGLSMPIEFGGFRPTNMGNETARIICARPVVGLFTGEGDVFQKSPRNTGVLVHELTHVMQRRFLPVMPADPAKFREEQLTRELEAYHIAAFYEQGLYESDDPQYQQNPEVFSSTLVESIRSQNQLNKNAPFKPSGTLIKALSAAGLDVTY